MGRMGQSLDGIKHVRTDHIDVCYAYSIHHLGLDSIEKELFDRILNHPIEALMHVFPCHSAASHDVPFVGFDAF